MTSRFAGCSSCPAVLCCSCRKPSEGELVQASDPEHGVMDAVTFEGAPVEGRTWRGRHHHFGLVTAAQGFPGGAAAPLAG